MDVTSHTMDIYCGDRRRRAARLRKDDGQNCPSSLRPASRPSTSRSPGPWTPVALTPAIDTSRTVLTHFDERDIQPHVRVAAFQPAPPKVVIAAAKEAGFGRSTIYTVQEELKEEVVNTADRRSAGNRWALVTGALASSDPSKSEK